MLSGESDLWVVHKHQGLGSNGGSGTVGLADEGVGCVKELHHGDQSAALHGEIDAAAAAVGIECAWAEHSFVDHAAYRNNIIANDLCLESLSLAAPVKGVFRIDYFVVGIVGGTELIDPAGHDEFVYGFEPPVVLDQLLSEPVE